MFEHKASGVKATVLPQVWVKPYMRERLEVAVQDQREKKGSWYSMAEYIREALREKMDRHLGPEPESNGLVRSARSRG